MNALDHVSCQSLFISTDECFTNILFFQRCHLIQMTTRDTSSDTLRITCHLKMTIVSGRCLQAVAYVEGARGERPEAAGGECHGHGRVLQAADQGAARVRAGVAGHAVHQHLLLVYPIRHERPPQERGLVE